LLRWICGHGVELRMAIAVDLPEVVCSRNGLENAVLNLVLNARDAMPAGGEITVRGRTYEDPIIGDCVSLSVEDTGVGMAPHVVARAFEPFFTTKPDGNGLGLSIVRRFANETGGYTMIDSTPGLGTTVELRLPARGRE
jgi:signal transduction histidine kinase